MRKVLVGFGVFAALAFGGLGQMSQAPLLGHLGRETLALLWINALELTPSQMKELLSLVDELMPLRDEIVAMPEKLHEDLLQFTGEPRKLRELLAAHQKTLREKLEALTDKFTSGLKKILTVAQWERLSRGLPRKEGIGAPQHFGFGRRMGPMPRGFPGARLDLWRGMNLVRFLPDLREALAAKLQAVGE